MKYDKDNAQMSIIALINAVSRGITTVPNAFWEDSASYIGYWGIQENTVNNAMQRADPFKGFMATCTISNQELSTSEYYFTACSGFGGCDACPYLGIAPFCQSTCDIDQYPINDGSCGDCDDTCGECCHDGHCGQCYDYYCESCSNYWEGDCTSCGGLSVTDSSDCKCTTNFLGSTYSRSDEDKRKPCCAENCKSCTDEQYYTHCTNCLDGTYKQPSSDSNLFVCFENCPSGYATNDTSDSCDLVNSGPQVVFDLTTIPDEITNSGSVTSISASGDLDGLARTLNAFKMRGRYSAGDGGVKV